jgi:hypothetical protein
MRDRASTFVAARTGLLPDANERAVGSPSEVAAEARGKRVRTKSAFLFTCGGI